MEQTKNFNSVLCIISSINPAFQRIYKKKDIQKFLFSQPGHTVQRGRDFFWTQKQRGSSFFGPTTDGVKLLRDPKTVYLSSFPVYPTLSHLFSPCLVTFTLFPIIYTLFETEKQWGGDIFGI